MHRVHLGSLALSIIAEAKQLTGASDYIFGSTRLTKTREELPEDLNILTDGALAKAIRNNKAVFGMKTAFTPP